MKNDFANHRLNHTDSALDEDAWSISETTRHSGLKPTLLFRYVTNKVKRTKQKSSDHCVIVHSVCTIYEMHWK